MPRYIFIIIFIFLAALYFFFPLKNCTHFCIGEKPRYIYENGPQVVGFNLVDPEEAPPKILKSVMRGYKIMMNTPFYASEYAKGHVSCGNCHFCEGNSLGGRDKGISLLGVTQIYPQFSKRSQSTIDIKERIYNCFERSMNGIRPPADSDVMLDLVNYLYWISSEVKEIKQPPWLGLKRIKNPHKPNDANGAKIYQKYCVACHQENGEGGGELPYPIGKTIPPIWGDYSFNNGAGMSMIEVFSSFVFYNMPYENSVLTEEEAIDVAAYVLTKPRPEYNPK